MKKILEVLIYLFFFIYSYSLTAKARSYNCEDFTKFALNKIAKINIAPQQKR